MLKKRCVLILLFLTTIIPVAGAADMATVHGVIYEWDTFEPLENVIVEVNSTPTQSMLARYGIYTFDLAPGNYLLSASYYQGSTLRYYAEEEIRITNDGDYVIDIIFLPTYYEEGEMNGSGFDELDELADLAESDMPAEESGSFSTLIYVAIVLVMVLAGAYVLASQRKADAVGRSPDGSEYLENDGLLPLSDGSAGLPADLQEVVSIISNNGGRITQKDLRSRLKHSEAKVSLMISDLENRGLVQKLKKGRGNVIILVGSEQVNQNV
ncbi:hypothetical protein CUN85_01115 [Methanolobus halotolerans]|uniref:DUF7343 domain-containing protein n=1 Tax=Methanolobus halotolerans TaxID=2052935 RepID=A0A4E0PZ14_9EURY|nr:hypothetical protein CUN85_01115 [Methanolobus halotolerans]